MIARKDELRKATDKVTYKVIDKYEKEIIKLREQGDSIRKIAIKLEMDKNKVHRIINKHRKKIENSLLQKITADHFRERGYNTKIEEKENFHNKDLKIDVYAERGGKKIYIESIGHTTSSFFYRNERKLEFLKNKGDLVFVVDIKYLTNSLLKRLVLFSDNILFANLESKEIIDFNIIRYFKLKL